MKYIVTWWSWFIWSVIVWYLNIKWITNIYVVDELDDSEKWKNLVNKDFVDYFDKNEFLKLLEDEKFKLEKDDIIIHMWAISATTEKDSNKLMYNNTKYTYNLFNLCQKIWASFIYASSAATYWDWENWYNDDSFDLEPLNMYWYSKYLLDKYLIRDTKNFTQVKWQVVWLKFFNVYWPNEYAKWSMSSVIFHCFNQIKKDWKVKLFKSYKSWFEDWEQKRDFIYVLDIVKVINFFIENKGISWIYNLWTGDARTFKDLASLTFDSLWIESNIDFVDMPELLREKYQYFTEANMKKLKNIWYKEKFYSLEEWINDYVKNYLNKWFKIY